MICPPLPLEVAMLSPASKLIWLKNLPYQKENRGFWMSWSSWLHKLYDCLWRREEGRENMSGGGEKDRDYLLWRKSHHKSAGASCESMHLDRHFAGCASKGSHVQFWGCTNTSPVWEWIEQNHNLLQIFLLLNFRNFHLVTTTALTIYIWILQSPRNYILSNLEILCSNITN